MFKSSKRFAWARVNVSATSSALRAATLPTRFANARDDRVNPFITPLPMAVTTDATDNTFPTVSHTSSGSHESASQKLNLLPDKLKSLLNSAAIFSIVSFGNKLINLSNSESMALSCSWVKLFCKFANLCRFSLIIFSAHDASRHLFDSVKKSYAA